MISVADIINNTIEAGRIQVSHTAADEHCRIEIVTPQIMCLRVFCS